MKKTLEERKEYAKIIAQAWVDEQFKKRLLDEPATVLAENGVEIPEGMTVKVVERKENEILIPLPPKPADQQMLSVEELSGIVAAGIGVDGANLNTTVNISAAMRGNLNFGGWDMTKDR